MGHSPCDLRPLLLAIVLASSGCQVSGCQVFGCRLGHAQPLMLAAGPSQSAQACLADAYAARLTEETLEYPASVLQTSGNIESLVALRDGRAQLAITTADVLAQAVNGEGAFAGRTVSARTIATLFTSSLHLVVPASSDIGAFSEVRGRAVATGPAESGMDLTASRALETARLDGHAAIRMLPWPELARGLRDGELAAFFWVDGVPSPPLEQLVHESGSTVRVLSTASVVPLLQRRYGEPLYQVSEIPADTYGTGESSAAVGVSTVLVARQDLADAAAFTVARALFRHAAHLARVCPAAGSLTVASGAQPEPAALHPGAALFYRSTPAPAR